MELHRLSDPYSLAGLKVEGHDVWTAYMIINRITCRVYHSCTMTSISVLTGASDGNILYIKLIYQQTGQPQLLSRSVLYMCTL